MNPVDYQILFSAPKDDRYACGVMYSYWTTRVHHCVIILHPIKECEISMFDAAIRLLHHEIMHDVLFTLEGVKAKKKWDNIAGSIIGCPCD